MHGNLKERRVNDSTKLAAASFRRTTMPLLEFWWAATAANNGETFVTTRAEFSQQNLVSRAELSTERMRKTPETPTTLNVELSFVVVLKLSSYNLSPTG